MLRNTVIMFLFVSFLMTMTLTRSSSELKELTRVELGVVKVLTSHSSTLQRTLSKVQRFTREVKEMYNHPSNNKLVNKKVKMDTTDVEEVLGNPLLNYKTLTRMVMELKEIQSLISSMDSSDSLSSLLGSTSLPKESALRSRAELLEQLRSVYDFNVSDMAQGRMMGQQTTSSLDSNDALILSRYAVSRQRPKTAMVWLEEAFRQTVAEVNDTKIISSEIEDDGQRRLKQMERMRKEVQRSIHSNTDSASEQFKLGKVPPKPTEGGSLTNEQDEINFRALCQGKELLGAKMKARLKCYLHSSHPLFRIQPLHVEEVHGAPHSVLLFHSLLGARCSSRLIKLARPKLENSSIGNTKSGSDQRHSSTAILHDGYRDVINVARKLNAISGLHTSNRLDQHATRHLEHERLQVAKYEMGEYYSMHHDAMFVYRQRADPVPMLDNSAGDRMATLMLYLSEVAMGGRTVFPRLGVGVEPEVGSLLFWFNLRADLSSDMLMLHAGCPVVMGNKWIANQWVREVPNMLNRPCQNPLFT